MIIERKTVRKVIRHGDVTEFEGRVSSIIEKMQALISEHGEDVFIELSDDTYSGYYSFDVYVERPQTDEEYNLMVTEIELAQKKSDTAEAKRIVGKKLSGKNITKKEVAFLNKLGINI